MWLYAGLCGCMWVGLCGPMWLYVGLCGRMWVYAGLWSSDNSIIIFRFKLGQVLVDSHVQIRRVAILDN